jgi:glycolate oxidase iron-sulfur subunit
VVVPKDQQCCGTPNIAEGERKVYREMAEHNIALFEDQDVETIVCDCAACGMELKAYRETMSPVTRAAKRAKVACPDRQDRG